MEWVVVISVLVMTILSLLGVNVILSITLAALCGGLMSGLSLTDTIGMFISGTGGMMETALSYIFLGAFAVAISYTGITTLLVNFIIRVLKGKKTMMLFVLAGVACLAENAIPVHIAFIPILIPPLLKVFDEMKLDRRAVATALTFGLKTPYIVIPAGFGLIYQGIVLEGLQDNGLPNFTNIEVIQAMLVPGLGMVIGLLIAIFITYRKDRVPTGIEIETSAMQADEKTVLKFEKKHFFTLIAIVVALVIQIVTHDLIVAALSGLIILFITVAVPFRKNDAVMADGIGLMGMIAFIMLSASGFGEVLKETGAIKALVAATTDLPGMDNKIFVAFMLLLVGLVITIGIGSSFGTVPIVAALYVPICIATGFSPLATAVLIGTAGALGDAGSPASDSTLGPTSGLNADGRHDHIWDTCVPTFIHFNIPLFIVGWIGAVLL